MHRRRFTSALGTGLSITLFGPSLINDAIGGPITPTSQDRRASAFTLVPPCQGQDSDNATAPDFLPFVATVDAVEICDFAQGVACAVQISEISSTTLSGWGNATSSAAAGVQTVIHSLPWSRYKVDFQIQSEAEYRIEGELNATGGPPVGSNAIVRLLTAGGAALVEQTVSPGPGGAFHSEPVQFAGVLPPGSYTLHAEAISFIDAMIPPQGNGQSTFNVVMHAAVPGDVNGDDVVGVDDLLEVIQSWGACPGKGVCTADIAPLGGNGVVDVDDLLKVIGNWG